MASTWDSGLYEDRHSFVWKAGADLLPMLDPKPGERILDVGCGTGHLTARIAEAGAHVEGLDSSVDMIGQARRNYPKIPFWLANASSFTVDEPFDAVFSNAALHWVLDADSAVRCIASALKPGGRFVAEFGGKGNIRQLLRLTLGVLRSRGYAAANPWFFPSVAEYAAILERHGFEVRTAMLFDRPTPLDNPDTGLTDWLRMFGGVIFGGIPQKESDEILAEITAEARPLLFKDGQWVTDYRRLRVQALRIPEPIT
jgi:trans-aconitate methyltransferase